MDYRGVGQLVGYAASLWLTASACMAVAAPAPQRAGPRGAVQLRRPQPRSRTPGRPVRPVPGPLGLPRPPLELVAQTGHAGFILSAALSPDGKQALTGGADRTARLWDVTSGKELRCFRGHGSGVASVAFSPDGKQALTGSLDETARLWEVATGRELRRLGGHGGSVEAVAFSPDGKQALTGSAGRAVRLWSVATGAELRRLDGHSGGVKAVAFSPDGKQALTGSTDRTARLWDLATGKELRRLEGHGGYVEAVAFSPNGKRVLTAGGDRIVRLWNVGTGQELRRLEGHANTVEAVSFSPDGRQVLTGSWDATARLWDSATGRESGRLSGHTNWVSSAAFSRNGKRVLTGSYDRTARLWDTRTQKELRHFRGFSDRVTALAVSPNGQQALIGSGDWTVRLWDFVTGSELGRFRGHTNVVDAAAFSPDGKQALTGSQDRTMRLWDVATGRELRRFTGHTNSVKAVAFSPDGTHLLSGSHDATARIWDAEAGQQLRSLAHEGWVGTVAFSPDGKQVLTGDGTARLWDVATGQEVRRFEVYDKAVLVVVFSPDGKQVLTGNADSTVRLWDATNGRELRRLEGHSDRVTSVAFSPDGKQVLTGSSDKTARLWDVATGNDLRLEGHSEAVGALAFSPDGKHALTGSWDGTAKFWDITSGKELCSLVSFRNGTWAVTDREGRYDASNGGDVEGLHWVLGLEPIELWQFKDGYYEPKLLPRKLGLGREDALRPVPSLADLRLYPEVQVQASSRGATRLMVHLTDRGGGIGPVEVYLNGKLAVPDARPRSVTKGPQAAVSPPRVSFPVQLPAQALAPGAKNRVEVYARTRRGDLRSRGAELAVEIPGRAPTNPTQLFAVVIGVSSYANRDLNLAFAAKDAHDFARALKIGAGRLYGEERVRIYYCSSEAGQPNSPLAPPDLPAPVPVRKSELARIFAAINRQAQPRDILVVYLAGHGVAYRREGKSGYAYLTQDARSPDVVNGVFLRDHAVTAQDLIEWTRLSRINKQVMILDTCYAGVVGQVFARLPDAPRSSADRIRALEQAKVAAGFHILMGCAGHRVSYESSRYGQGLLTRALLQGLQGAALEGRIANVERWFNYAQVTVPDLAREANLSEQRPQISRPGSGEGFPVGEFTGTEVMLPNARPIILAPTGFFNRDTLQHDRHLKDAVGEQLLKLQEEAIRKGGRGDALLFTYLRGVAEHPHALIPSGSYTVQNGEAVVKVRLEKGATFGEKDVRGPDLGNGREALAARIGAAIVELARDLERK